VIPTPLRKQVKNGMAGKSIGIEKNYGQQTWGNPHRGEIRNPVEKWNKKGGLKTKTCVTGNRQKKMKTDKYGFNRMNLQMEIYKTFVLC
jgi:hypothetical protein